MELTSTTTINGDVPSPSVPNPRKRPLSDGSVTDEHTNSQATKNEGENVPSPPTKRSRGSDWQLENNSTGASPTSRRVRARKTSPSQIQNSDKGPRPSKFIEGSMNDRVSKMPPSLYTGQEEALESYMGEVTPSQVSTIPASADPVSLYDAGIETARPSTMYRFGKAIANAFNPVSAWKGFWRDREEPKDPQQKLLQDRQAKAEKAYADLKRSGFKGTKPAPSTFLPAATPVIQYDTAPSTSQPASFRDSAIDVDELRPSGESNRDSRTVEDVMPAPSVPFTRRSVSPMPNTNGRRSSLTLPTPLKTLKRVGSHLQLPSSKRNSAQESILSTTESVNSDATVRKQPSKKDLLKQQRLHKKVSNLEMQLEAARRELEEAQGLVSESPVAPLTTRKTFTPGALPSLPSERLLKDPVDGTSTVNQPIAPAKEKLPGANLRSKFSANPSPEKGATRGRPAGRKRKSAQMDNIIMFPNLGVKTPKAVESAAPVESVNKRPRILPDTMAPKNTARSLPRAQSEHDIRNPQKQVSQKRAAATEPPVPALPAPFEPSQVDRIKIMMMRNSSDYGEIPFGKSPMDAVNLRKAYPLITDAQVQEVLGNHPSELKTTDFTSTAHVHNRASTPSFNPPRSVSPNKDGFVPAISKSSLRSRNKFQAPQNSPASLRRTAQEEFEEITQEAAGQSKAETENGSGGAREEEQDTVAPLSEPVKKGLPPYPKDPSLTVQSPVKTQQKAHKPLPAVQKEDFQWDEDVF